MFDMLIKVIVINKILMFCEFNKKNDPFGYLLLHVGGKMTN